MLSSIHSCLIRHWGCLQNSLLNFNLNCRGSKCLALFLKWNRCIKNLALFILVISKVCTSSNALVASSHFHYHTLFCHSMHISMEINHITLNGAYIWEDLHRIALYKRLWFCLCIRYVLQLSLKIISAVFPWSQKFATSKAFHFIPLKKLTLNVLRTCYFFNEVVLMRQVFGC